MAGSGPEYSLGLSLTLSEGILHAADQKKNVVHVDKHTPNVDAEYER
jgi:hypothetical protein